MQKRHGLNVVIVISALAVLAPLPACPAGEIVNDRNVKQAIDKAVGYLYSIRNKEGVWDDPKTPADFKTIRKGGKVRSLLKANWPGRTALALNALASAGQQSDPRFRKALKWLMAQEMIGTYGIGMRMELVHRLRDSQTYRSVLEKDKRFLLRSMRADKGGRMWQYTPPPSTCFYSYIGDFSCTNYGVLGLWAAGNERLETPARVWRDLERTYVLGQLTDGSWTYYQARHVPAGSNSIGNRPSASMTTAGIASLYLVIDQIYARRGKLGSYRRTRAYKSIRRGMKWMEKNFSATDNHGWPEFATYYFYNCERVAQAAGIKYFGSHDWFREIAATILKAQKPNGSVPYKLTNEGYGGVLVDTAFSLLFLAKGSAPVVINKLRHSGDWDNHARELAALTGWLAKRSERPANWQVVNLKVPVEELTDSRILYIAGTKPLKFDEAGQTKLKRFVQLGGLLVFHPDTASPGFTGSVRNLLEKLWPKLELTNVDLADHPLGTIYLPIKDKSLRIQQLACPTRVLAFVVHGAPADAWEKRLYATRKDAFVLGANLHYFACDRASLKKMPTKLTCFAEVFARPFPAVNRTVTLARIKYGDNPHLWDPEPLAFERFSRLLAAKEKIKCEIKVVIPEQLAVAGAKVAHLTGSGDPGFTKKQLDAIRAWIDAGGTLIADQAGGHHRKGRNAFDAAFRKIVADWYGPDAMGTMFSRHPMLRGLGKVTYRHVAGSRRKKLHPRLECVRRDKRAAIIYSRYDLTCGLLGNPNPLVAGANADGAYEILSRLILSATGKP